MAGLAPVSDDDSNEDTSPESKDRKVKTRFIRQLLLLLKQDIPLNTIAKDARVSPDTLKRWIKKMGGKVKKGRRGYGVLFDWGVFMLQETDGDRTPADDAQTIDIATKRYFGDITKDEAVALARMPPPPKNNRHRGPMIRSTNIAEAGLANLENRIDEDTRIAEVAQVQGSAAEQYQAYIAGQGIQLMRDALPRVKKPTTVKELEVLDGIIRRSLGLGSNNGKGGGGGKVVIDISILNDERAGRHVNGVQAMRPRQAAAPEEVLVDIADDE